MSKDVITPISEEELLEGLNEAIEYFELEPWFDGADVPAIKDIMSQIAILRVTRNLNWARAFSAALAKTWPKLNESTAAATVLFIALYVDPEEFLKSLPMAAVSGGDIMSLEKTLRQVAPEFIEALKNETASPAGILLRVIISTTLQVDPKKPADAFLVDASAQALENIFGLDAEGFVTEIFHASDADEEEEDDERRNSAIGFALILCGANGMREIWIQEPDDQGRQVIASIAKELSDLNDLSQEEILALPNLVAAAAKTICVHNANDEALAHLLGVVSESLDAQGLIISVDPELPTLYETVITGAFHAIKGGEPDRLRVLMHRHPAVESFRDTLSLFEDVKSTFNDRLTAIGEQLNQMRPSEGYGEGAQDYEEDDED